MDILQIMKDKVYVWWDGRDMRASKRGRERRSSQSVEGLEGLVGGVGHGQRVPVMEWTSQGWFSTHLCWCDNDLKIDNHNNNDLINTMTLMMTTIDNGLAFGEVGRRVAILGNLWRWRWIEIIFNLGIKLADCCTRFLLFVQRSPQKCSKCEKYNIEQG